MALDRLTKIDGGGISTTSDYRVGIITASKFVGPFDGTGGNFSGVVTATNGVFSGNISAVDGNFSGNVTIGGTLTYEDVTNIDSVGIITAQKDIHVGAGVSVVGIVTAATFKGDGDFVDIDVDGHTELDNVNIAGVATFSQGGSEVVRINSGGLLLYNDLSFFGASTHAYWDRSANQFKLNDDTKLSVGSDSDLQIYHGSNISYINDSYGDLRIMSNTLRLQRQAGGENFLYAIEGGKVSLFYDGYPKFETTNTGAVVTGILTATSFSGPLTGNVTGTASGNPTLTSGANNRVVTATGANALTGETNLTWDATTLKIQAATPALEISGTNSNGGNSSLHFNANANHWVLEADNYTQQNIFSIKEGTTSSSTPRLSINASGQTIINSTGTESGTNTKLSVCATGSPGSNPTLLNNVVAAFRATGSSAHAASIAILAGNGGSSAVHFGDTDNDVIGRLIYNHTSGNTSDYFEFYLQGSRRFRIQGNGNLCIGNDSNFTAGAKVEIRDTIGGGGGTGLILNDIGSSGANEGLHIEWRSGSDKQSDQCRIGQAANSTGSGSAFFVATNAGDSGSSTERLRIQSDGKIYIGHTASGTYDGIQPQIQLEGTNYNTSSMSLFCNSNTANNAPQLQLGKSRSGSDGGTTALQNNDRVGSIYGIAADGSDRNSSVGRIEFYVDGSVSTDQTPGSIRFGTTASNGSTPTERLRIDSNGKLQLLNSEGIQLSAKNSNLYTSDGSLSYYGTTNAVYLNGAGASGWLRLSAAGTANNRTAINLYGQSVSAIGDSIDFRTNSTERFRIKSNGLAILGNVANTSGVSNAALHIESAGMNVESGYDTDDVAGNACHLTLSGQSTRVRMDFGTLNVAPYAGFIQARFDNNPFGNSGSDDGLEPLLLNPRGGVLSYNCHDTAATGNVGGGNASAYGGFVMRAGRANSPNVNNNSTAIKIYPAEVRSTSFMGEQNQGVKYGGIAWHGLDPHNGGWNGYGGHHCWMGASYHSTPGQEFSNWQLQMNNNSSPGSYATNVAIQASPAGYVTKPSQPIFLAHKTDGVRITGTGYVTFGQVHINNGSHYDSSNGRFTAPIAGYYFFYTKINGYNRMDFQLRVNGRTTNVDREYGQFATDSSSVGWWSNIVQRHFYLDKNEYVQVYISNINQNSDPGAWNTFGGWLVA